MLKQLETIGVLGAKNEDGSIRLLWIRMHLSIVSEVIRTLQSV